MHPLYKSRIWFPLAMRNNAMTKNRIGITKFFIQSLLYGYQKNNIIALIIT